MGSTHSSSEKLLSAFAEIVAEHPTDATRAFERSLREHLAAERTQEQALANANVHAAELMVKFEDLNAELVQSNAKLLAQRDLERKLAAHIQTSVLPTEPALPGLDIAARMIAADDIGGDYFDVIETPLGGWIGIGDVSGHGFDAGMIMLMTQSALSAVVRADPEVSPAPALRRLNAVLFDNLHRRLKSDDYVTLSLLRYERGGHVVLAGAHEDIIVRRASGTIERLETAGTWMAVTDDLDSMLPESHLTLGRGDLLFLYTDGLTEARSATGELLGLDRVCAELERASVDEPPGVLVERILRLRDHWSPHLDDDVAIVAARYRGT